MTRFKAAAIVAVLIAAGPLAAQQTATDLPTPYKQVDGWAQMPAGRTWGAPAAVDIDPDGKSVWVFE